MSVGNRWRLLACGNVDHLGDELMMLGVLVGGMDQASRCKCRDEVVLGVRNAVDVVSDLVCVLLQGAH